MEVHVFANFSFSRGLGKVLGKCSQCVQGLWLINLTNQSMLDLCSKGTWFMFTSPFQSLFTTVFLTCHGLDPVLVNTLRSVWIFVIPSHNKLWDYSGIHCPGKNGFGTRRYLFADHKRCLQTWAWCLAPRLPPYWLMDTIWEVQSLVTHKSPQCSVLASKLKGLIHPW